jgi:protein-export membrane protein SecD/preprotein translocase SecF subunit
MTVAVGLLAVIFVFNLKPKLGLDLQGGLSVTLTAPSNADPELLEKSVEILSNRVDSAGVAESQISREGNNNIFIQLPGTEDPQRLLRLIGKTAQLQFRQVKRVVPPGGPDYESLKVAESDDPAQELVLADEQRNKYELSRAEVTGDAVRTGSARPNQAGGWEVVVDFKRDGSDAWARFTGRLACEQGVTRQIAIVLDGRVESSPQVDPEIQCNEGITGGTTIITGDFDETEAKDLALVLTAGALPVKLEQSEVRTVSATLGRDSLRAGLLAGALGLLLVMFYVLIYYRTLGLQTWVGLAVFGAITYGLVVLFGEWIGWSLTLAGIAGLIVSIGIAADSYIVFFERVKEEIHEGRNLRTSIDRGFQHAWRTMRAANMVTILAAVVLYFLAVGPVRGFALALGVATLLDLAVTYFFTWPLAGLLAQNRFFAENRLLGMRAALEGGQREGSLLRKIYRSEFKIDFVGLRRRWFLLSGLVVLISVVALVPGVRGLSYAIDFRGGTIYRAPAPESLSVRTVQDEMEKAGLENPLVQILTDRSTGETQVQVETPSSLSPEARDDVTQTLQRLTGSDVSDITTEAVGRRWGGQVTAKALRGLAIFLVLVIAYMSWRLEPKMALASIMALLHDLVVTAGIYALVGFEVSPATVIAILTILGYSLYDTVVIFDKTLENQALPGNARKSFAEIANDSSNQVLMRSFSTSLSTLLPVGSLLFVGSILLGADTLKDLALALFVGVAASTYSSLFVAVPLLSLWKEKEPRYAAMRVRAARVGAAGGQKAVSGDGPEPSSKVKQQADRSEPVDETSLTARARPNSNGGRAEPGATRTATAAKAQPRRHQPRAKRKKKSR